jgi:hypothetical protein
MRGKIAAAKGPDRLVMIAGLVFFIDSFLPWYGVLGFSASGWSVGGLAVISILLAIAATAIAVAGVTGIEMGSAPMGTLLLATSGGAFAFALLRLLTQTHFVKYGLYIAIVAGAVMTYGAYQKFTAAKK